jgi:aquaporin SIP
MITIFGLIGAIFGGASFNPSTTVAFYSAGLSPTTTLLSLAVRFPAQAAGAVAGAKAVIQVMPERFRFMLKGPGLKVNSHTGVLVEGALTFILSFNLLLIMLKGPENMLVKIYLLSLSTMGLVFVGSKFTGPSMNPANAFGWAYVKDWHNDWDLYYVYWIGPLIGATLAGKVFVLLFPPPSPAKEKDA